jgi:phosphoglucomutase
LEEIFRRCGCYRDEQVAVSLQGKEGKEQIGRIMKLLRGAKPQQIGGQKVRSIEDFLISKRTVLHDNTEEQIHLPQENVLRFSFAGGGFVMARPSGTEPKIRFYFCIKGDSSGALESRMEEVKADFLGKIKAFMA